MVDFKKIVDLHNGTFDEEEEAIYKLLKKEGEIQKISAFENKLYVMYNTITDFSRISDKLYRNHGIIIHAFAPSDNYTIVWLKSLTSLI